MSKLDGTVEHLTQSLACSEGSRDAMIVVAADVHPLLNIKDVYLLERGPSMFLLHILGGGSMVLAGFLSSHQLVCWAFMKHLLHVWCCVPEESPVTGLLP